MAYSETRFTSEPIWHRPWFAPAAVGVAAVSIFLASYALEANQGQTFGASLPGSTVKVELVQSHGSGVHIGDGLVLSAAHVASEGDVVKLKLDDGTTRDAKVVWASKASDIALLQTSPTGLSASPLSCAPAIVGQPVTARGNPLVLEFVTTYGHIVGAPRQMQEWASVVPVDMVILPGMSGGPLFNSAGEVVGINVAVLTVPLGLSASITGLGMVVDAKHICSLLGRT
jgi:S1-C subfamily serine protease